MGNMSEVRRELGDSEVRAENQNVPWGEEGAGPAQHWPKNSLCFRPGGLRTQKRLRHQPGYLFYLFFHLLKNYLIF